MKRKVSDDEALECACFRDRDGLLQPAENVSENERRDRAEGSGATRTANQCVVDHVVIVIAEPTGQAVYYVNCDKVQERWQV